MLWEFVLGFAVLVAASYLGTTMALRGFFGRERYAPDFEERIDGQSESAEPTRGDTPSGEDESSDGGESNETDGE
jgi:hypothetical protein